MGICWSDPEPPKQQTLVVQTPFQSQPSYSQQSYPQYSYTVVPPAYMTPSQSIQIYVKTLTGTVFPVGLFLSDTIYQLKQRITAVSGIQPHQQVLMYIGKQLDDSKYVYNYSVTNGCTVYLVLRMG